MSILEIESVHRSFGGVQALQDVSLSFQAGAVTGLIGPNGAGKSTLINVVTGLFHPDRGTVRYRGQALGEMAPHRRTRLGIVRTFQNTRLFDKMTVRDNLRVVAHCGQSRGTRDSSAARLEGIAAEFEISPWLERPAGELPLGVRRRVELARAVSVDARVLLLDEPTSGMSDAEAIELSRAIRGLADRGVAVVLVEHNMSVVMPISDQLYVLEFGRLISSGPPETVQSDAAVIRAYLGTDDDESV
jgi:branched-chain amino acid transport system ATP-binding protein